mmetsp:Transcript_33288/g.37119  ORF Transcript_33288/g.37119 Transcript_33288/m.37119 type:complete len:131 (-) Transcript_33288:334-726(-)
MCRGVFHAGVLEIVVPLRTVAKETNHFKEVPSLRWHGIPSHYPVDDRDIIGVGVGVGGGGGGDSNSAVGVICVCQFVFPLDEGHVGSRKSSEDSREAALSEFVFSKFHHNLTFGGNVGNRLDLQRKQGLL